MKIISVKNLLILASLSSLTACKKDAKHVYTCECINPGGVYATYELNDTKKGAKSTCDKYSAEANTIPWSESGCTLK